MKYVITGGGSGIGQALALNLASKQKEVLICGRREQKLDETVARSHGAIQAIVCDVSTEEGRKTLIESLSNESSIKALIHNAGIIEPLQSMKEIQLSAWRQTLATNLEAPLFLTQGLLDKLEGGRVLHISSGAAHEPFPSWAAYCVSKAALFMLYQQFKLEVPDVFFGSVMPGITDTAMVAKVCHEKNLSKEQLDFFNDLKSKELLIQPDTLAQFLSWLILEVDSESYASREWDIYDSSHHDNWLKEGIIPQVFENE